MKMHDRFCDRCGCDPTLLVGSLIDFEDMVCQSCQSAEYKALGPEGYKFACLKSREYRENKFREEQEEIKRKRLEALSKRYGI